MELEVWGKRVVPRKAQLGKKVFQAVVLVVVVWGIALTARRAGRDLQQQRSELVAQAEQLERTAVEASDPRATALRAEAQRLRRAAEQFWRASPGGLMLACATYALGLLPAAFFWRKCLHSVGQRVPMLDVLWAYLYGNLGKYFPGKAMVLVLRVAELAPHGVLKTTVTVTIFMETLTLMAVGGVVSGICLMVLEIDWRWTLLSAGLVAATGLPTHPALLRYILPRLQRGVDAQTMEQWTRQITWRLMAQGWGLLLVTWLLWGASLTAVLASLPVAEVTGVAWWRLWLAGQAAVGLAVVLGFVSLVPGGAGVRELVLSVVLSPIVGPAAALSSAIWMRIVWLATELACVGGVAGFRMLRSNRGEES
ncbi:MAG: UPF0104 family protein [Planctomycetota bacterium]|nr:MAG: UPF0104 family protein [Planctomycetota bacterium]